MTLCYVDAEDDVDARRAALTEYGFTCGCERCTQEALDGLLLG